MHSTILICLIIHYSWWQHSLAKIFAFRGQYLGDSSLSLSLLSSPWSPIASLCPLICESRSRRSDILADSEDFTAGLLMVFAAKTTQCHARSIPHLPRLLHREVPGRERE